MVSRSRCRRGSGNGDGPDWPDWPDWPNENGGPAWGGDHERYFASGEHQLYACRRHLAVLELPGVVLFVSVALFVFALWGPYEGAVAVLGFFVLVAGAGNFAGRLLQWWMLRYVLTNTRVLLVEGVLSRRVRGVPLRLVIDTNYRRTFGGRLLGYGDLELNLSGQPGLRTLTMLPQPDVMYRWIVSLAGGASSARGPEPSG